MSVGVEDLREMVKGAQFEAFANSVIQGLLDRVAAAENERDALRAELEAVKQQCPVAWMNAQNGFISKDNKNPDYSLPLIVALGSAESITPA